MNVDLTSEKPHLDTHNYIISTLMEFVNIVTSLKITQINEIQSH